MLDQFHVFVCARTSDAETLNRDLARSPAIAKNSVGLTILWNQRSASSAFAEAMEKATTDFLVFTHCDVYFPTRWFERLAWEINRLDRIDPDWAVAGFSAMTPFGEQVGRVWDCSLEPLSRGLWGTPLDKPVRIVSSDEMAFVIRRRAGMLFDSMLPEFHLYGTDVILNAEREGKRSYCLDMPLIHNAKAQLHFGRDYRKSYNYMVQKWRHRLPLLTTCGVLTSNPLVPLLRRMRVRYKAIFRSTTYSNLRIQDPSAKAVELGLDELLAAGMVSTRSELEAANV